VTTTLCLLPLLFSPLQDTTLNEAFARAGNNRPALEEALERVPDDQRDGMRWLIEHMPARDLQSLDADYLLENSHHAYEAWTSSPWHDSISEELFFDSILPYASVNERRDRWRADFRERFSGLVANAKTPAEATAILNGAIYRILNVKYSTKRPKPDQSPYESMDAGLASCTGLTVLLVDACRAVGVPARFVGTPLWSDGSGNHSWVEVWDEGDWHFTGAAEPSGMDLDKGWFAGRAATCTPDNPRHGIYATTWRRTPIHFPMVWAEQDESVNAVYVTERYTAGKTSLLEGMARVRFRVRDAATGERLASSVIVGMGMGTAIDTIMTGSSKGESFDANDHLAATLKIGAEFYVLAHDAGRASFARGIVESDEQLVDLQISEAADALAHGDVEDVKHLLVGAHNQRRRADRKAEFDSRTLTIGDKKMPFWFKVYGERPATGRSLYISMHGGGGAPAAVNDRQWENQKKLYEPEEGVYLAPRAATNTWDLWHQAHIDAFFDQLIADMVQFEGVDPDKVYFMGYSAGGDGVYQLAPRMADRLAAAAMMAGHPNETQPDSLRNLPFTLHMGADDSAYNRNKIAGEWKTKLASLRADDEKGYQHDVQIHEGKGHWMERQDAVAVPWMAKFIRDLRPERIVWLQDDVTHDRFYWLSVAQPAARSRVVVERKGQAIHVVEFSGVTELTFRLDDKMFDLDKEIVVTSGDKLLFRGIVPRSVATLSKTLAERNDPGGMFCAEVTCKLE
jgi:poly(3-hydroxybutyrate) depolymerase